MEIKERRRSIIDLRDFLYFSKFHFVGASSFPFSELKESLFELPPRGSSLILVSDSVSTLLEGKNFLLEHKYVIEEEIVVDNEENSFWEQVKSGKFCGIEQNSSFSKRLWKACSFLEEFVSLVKKLLISKTQFTAIDLACGSGRDAIFLAERGFLVTGVDYEHSLLDNSSKLAKQYNCQNNFIPFCYDLEQGSLDSLRQVLSPVDLVHVARYLHRPLFSFIKEDLIKPGGFIIYHTFTKGVEKFGKPKKQRFILQPNELKLIFQDFIIYKHGESIIEDGRPIQFIIAQKKKN